MSSKLLSRWGGLFVVLSFAATAAGADRTDDRSAIGAVMQSLSKAFSSGNAKAIAAHWTAEGEFQNDAGIKIQGRPALESRFTMLFTKAPDAKAEINVESIRFLSSDLAVSEGIASVRRGPADAAKRAKFSASLVREDGEWRIAQLRETSELGDSVEDLRWLIGQWKSQDKQGAEIVTKYGWAPNKKFLLSTFTRQDKSLALSGEQVIGVDPATGSLHSWTFEANGGIGEADWQRDGDHWVLHVVGTLADGKTLKETNVLRRINNDTITWQSVERTLDDVEIPDLPPVKVVRVKPEN